MDCLLKKIKAYNISNFHITKEDGKSDYDEFYICKDNVIFLEAYRNWSIVVNELLIFLFLLKCLTILIIGVI